MINPRPGTPERRQVSIVRTDTCVYSIDDQERGETYGAPQFVHRFGSFAGFLPIYGGGQKLRADLEQVKRHLYVAS